jgi:tetratricopeptide (TPR) repeat protein
MFGRTAIAVLAAVALHSGSARGEKNEDARRQFTAAQESFDQGDYAEALVQYQEVYDAIKSPLLLFNIAQCHRNLGQWPEAAALFRRFLREADKPPNADAVEDTVEQLDRLIEAVAHLRQGRRRRALEIFVKVRDTAELPVLERDIGRTHERLGEYDEARDAYRRYLDKNPLAPDRDEILADIERLDRELARGVVGPIDGERRPLYKRWWFWGGVAAVVVAGSVTAIALSGGQPDSALGNIGFDR